MTRLLENSSDLRAFLSERTSNILIAVGIVLTITGVLTFSMNTSMWTIATLCFGILSILVGFLKKIGLLTFDTGLKRKIGSLLILSSVIILTGAFVSPMKIDVVRMWVPGIGAANPLHHNYHFQEANPLSIFFTSLLIIGLSCGAVGLILRGYMR
jgi:low temperature requirement protein LtrA